MRKSNKEIRSIAKHYIDTIGVDGLNKAISESLQYLSEDEGAMSNVNQIDLWVRVLFYLRYEYKPIEETNQLTK